MTENDDAFSAPVLHFFSPDEDLLRAWEWLSPDQLSAYSEKLQAGRVLHTWAQSRDPLPQELQELTDILREQLRFEGSEDEWLDVLRRLVLLFTPVPQKQSPTPNELLFETPDNQPLPEGIESHSIYTIPVSGSTELAELTRTMIWHFINQQPPPSLEDLIGTITVSLRDSGMNVSEQGAAELIVKLGQSYGSGDTVEEAYDRLLHLARSPQEPSPNLEGPVISIRVEADPVTILDSTKMYPKEWVPPVLNQQIGFEAGHKLIIDAIRNHPEVRSVGELAGFFQRPPLARPPEISMRLERIAGLLDLRSLSGNLLSTREIIAALRRLIQEDDPRLR